MIMPFGKHRGKPICNIPADYLRWVLKSCDNATPQLRRAIEHELRPNVPPGRAVPSVKFAELVPVWYRKLAQEFHPDKRGSHDAMIAVTRAKDLLVEMAGVEQ